MECDVAIISIGIVQGFQIFKPDIGGLVNASSDEVVTTHGNHSQAPIERGFAKIPNEPWKSACEEEAQD